MTAHERSLIAEAEKLTPMIRRAADALAQATTAAEFLDASDQASVVYDAAKVASRFLKAKAAQVEVIAACHQAMGDALKIKAAALCRIADEYDAAQARGEVQTPGGDRKSINVLDRNIDPPTVTDIGLSRKLVHEAREVRDAEKAEPHIVAKTIDEKLKAGEAPQSADVKRATRKVLDQLAAAKAPKQTAPEWQPPAPTTTQPAKAVVEASVNDGLAELQAKLLKVMGSAEVEVSSLDEMVDRHNNLADLLNEMIARHDAQVGRGNRLLAELQELEAEHDQLLAEYNQLVDDYNDLRADGDEPGDADEDAATECEAVAP